MQRDEEPIELAGVGIGTDRIGRNWKWVAAFGLLGATVGVAITALRPAEYAARMSVFFPSRSAVLGSNSMEGSVGSAAAVLGSAPSPLRVFQAFLESQTAVTGIARKFDMQRKDLLENRAVDSDPRTSLLTVTYVDVDKQRAQKVLQSHVEALRAINSKVSFNTMEDDLKVLQDKLADAKQKMMAAQAKLVQYERRTVSAPTIATSPTGIAATPGTWAQSLIQLQLEKERLDRTLQESKTRVQALARLLPSLPSELPPIKRLRPKLIETELQLETNRRNLGPQAPEVRHLENQVSVLKENMARDLRAYLRGVDNNMIDPSVAEGELPTLLTSRAVIDAQISVLQRLAAAAPGEAMELNRLYQDVNLQFGVVQQLTNQNLMATLQAQRDPNRWVILDEPWVEDKPVNKSFGRGALLGLFLGSLLGIAAAMTRR